MFCEIALRPAEDLVVVGSLKYLARINVALSIEGVAAILHDASYVQRKHASNIQSHRSLGIPQMGEGEADAVT
jgi:hypothetical protein